MTVKVNCPRCNQRYGLADELAGAKVQCPQCSEKFIVRDMPRTLPKPLFEPRRTVKQTPPEDVLPQREVRFEAAVTSGTGPARNCSRCGRRMADATSAFCPGCGAALPAGSGKEQPAGSTGRAGNRRRLAVAAGVAVAGLILLGALAAMLHSRGKPEPRPPILPSAAETVPPAAPAPLAAAAQSGSTQKKGPPAHIATPATPLPPKVSQKAKTDAKPLAPTDPVSVEVSALVTSWLTDVKGNKPTGSYWVDPVEEESLWGLKSWQILSVVAVGEDTIAVAIKVDDTTENGAPLRQNWRLLMEKREDRWKLVTMIE